MPHRIKEVRTEWGRQYREKNIDKIRAYQKTYQAKWRKENEERARDIQRKHRAKYKYELKREVCNLLGGQRCVNCGVTDMRVLEVNHINGGGSAEVKRRKRETGKTYGSNDLYQDIKHNRVDRSFFNILCRPCNAMDYLCRKYGESEVMEMYKFTRVKFPPVI